jgi:hypothetical protein
VVVGVLLMVVGCAQTDHGDQLGMDLFSTYMALTDSKWAPSVYDEPQNMRHVNLLSVSSLPVPVVT